AVADVRAVGLLADGVEVQTPHEIPQLLVALAHRGARLDPLGPREEKDGSAHATLRSRSLLFLLLVLFVVVIVVVVPVLVFLVFFFVFFVLILILVVIIVVFFFFVVVFVVLLFLVLFFLRYVLDGVLLRVVVLHVILLLVLVVLVVAEPGGVVSPHGSSSVGGFPSGGRAPDEVVSRFSPAERHRVPPSQHTSSTRRDGHRHARGRRCERYPSAA